MEELERQDKLAFVMDYVRNQSALVYANSSNTIQSHNAFTSNKHSTKRVDSMKSKDGSTHLYLIFL